MIQIMRKYKIQLIIFFIACNFTTFAQKKASSVLSSGDIFEFAVENNGIYKMTYEYLNQIEEIDINSINPQNLNIYSSGGGIVPQILSQDRIDDLEAVPIFVSGGNDGSFDQEDYIMFYMEGADKFHISDISIDFEKNIYNTRNHFYLKLNDTQSVRVETQPALSDVDFVSASTETVIRHEQERFNLLGSFGSTQGSGKQWFGETFANQNEQDFSNSFQIPDLIPNSVANLQVNFAARSSLTTSYEVDINGQKFSKTISSTDLGNIEAVYAKTKSINENIELPSGNPSISINFLEKGENPEAWLDYIQLIARKNIVYSDQPIYVFDRESADYSSFGFEYTGENTRVWDISNITNIAELETISSGNNHTFSYINGGNISSFIIFNDTDISNLPDYIGEVANQNLHSINEADLIIVYYKEFKEAAEKLANHRTQHDGFEVVIADIEQIYKEFGGVNDPSALRDFAKMVFDRDPNFKYFLLLGDGTYDYRSLVPDLSQENFIPTYQTDESLHPVEAFPSDDFYALLTNGEGGDSLNGALDIGVGRIPVKTLDEALGVVNKIINYDTSEHTLGDWRMRLGFTADDEDSNTHVRQADGIARLTESLHPEFNQQKVYFDAFNQEATPGGARYTDAKNALITNINSGQLVLNYLGHGGPRGWAQERVFQTSDIVNLRNIDRLPLLITATCSFTGFDEPAVVSAGEEALLNPSGGAIALFSTVRAVYSSQNERITREVFETIFTKNEGKALRFGDIMRISQNANSSDTISSNTRKFLLFGDPSQRISTPEYKVSLNKINNLDIVPGQIDTIGALGRMKLAGNIQSFDNQVLNDFDGTLFLTVFDKPSNLKTLDNDGEEKIFDFTLKKNILYKGSATIINGEFEIEFVIPKDINFEFGKGSLSMYASDNVSKDAGGHYENVIIGGTSETDIADNEGPEIDLFLDDRSFIFGDQTGNSPLLIIDLSDESGINLSSTSIGHDITAIFDDENGENLILNDFFQPSLDQVGSGSVQYQLNNIEPGLHSINVKAWDILNNSSEERTEFLVVESSEGFIKNVFNFPNPVINFTNFSFEHDLNGNNLDILVSIFSSSGQLVTKIQAQRFGSGRIIELPWSAEDAISTKLENGIYFYKIKISSNELNVSRESDFQKLVILN